MQIILQKYRFFEMNNPVAVAAHLEGQILYTQLLKILLS
jgi:hypothetical protein